MYPRLQTARRAQDGDARGQGESGEELKRAFKAALELVTESDCSGWFSPCGYQVTLDCVEL